MGANITGTLATLDSTDTVTGLEGKIVYLLPSRTNILTLKSAVWYPLEKNTDNEAGYEYARKATTNASGVFTFTNVPYTDTEIDSDAALPAVEWNVIDRSTGRVFRGAFPSSVGAGPFALRTLIDSHSWVMEGAAWSAPSTGTEAHGTLTFTSSSDEAAVTFSTAFSSANYRVTFGEESGTSGAQYKATVKTATRTVNGFTVKLSSIPAAGDTVYVFFKAEF